MPLWAYFWYLFKKPLYFFEGCLRRDGRMMRFWCSASWGFRHFTILQALLTDHLNGPETAIIARMGEAEQNIAKRQEQLTVWLSEEADGFPGCRIGHYTASGKYGYSWKVFLNDVQMGVIILTTQATLPEDKIRAHFRVELRQKLGQPV
jgi:hypothetical protein